MKPKYRHIFKFVLLVFLLLSGCITPGAFIRNEETYSQNIPIKTKPTFLIFGENLLLNEYSLRYKRNTPDNVSYTILSTYKRNKSGRRYDFYKKGQKLYTVDIIKSDKESDIGNVLGVDVSVKYNIEMAIIIHNNYSKEEFKINLDERRPYVLFKDSNIGEINFDYYKSSNKNNPKDNYEIFAGFKINVNNEEYGLLAIHYPSLYLKNNIEITDKMALYILATYAHYIHYGREELSGLRIK
jgi:hypothetical protein